jgi:hypothetical protein
MNNSAQYPGRIILCAIFEYLIRYLDVYVLALQRCACA